MANRELDNKAAIMIVIEHLGAVQPGQKCSAVFFDREKIRAEKEFHAKLYSQNGVHGPEILHAMVEANVPAALYWLVSIKPAQGNQRPNSYSKSRSPNWEINTRASLIR